MKDGCISTSFRGAVRSVRSDHIQDWRALQREALHAHEAFVTAARGAAIARHRGQDQRARTLTRLARKQHQRWVAASLGLGRFEG